jgi:hypothetical protein
MASQRVVVTNRASAHEGTPAVLARYPDVERLRGAIASLEAHGVDGDDLVLAGPGAVQLEELAGSAATDAHVASHTGTRVAIAIVLGAAVGAVIGAVAVGATLLVWSNTTAKGWIFVLMVSWFAAGGGVVGAYLAFFRTLGFSDAMPLTYAGEPLNEVWLAIYGTPADVEPKVLNTEPDEMVTAPVVRTVHPDEGGAFADAHVRKRS